MWGKIREPRRGFLLYTCGDYLEGLVVRRIALGLSLALAMPSMAFSADKREGSYYCTEKFSGGLAYSDAQKEWHGAIFKPHENFVMKLRFRDTTKGQDQFGATHEYDNYDVTITDEGSSQATDCRTAAGNPPFITHDKPLLCRSGNCVFVVLRAATPIQNQFRHSSLP
jgi:hypothetical protein